MGWVETSEAIRARLATVTDAGVIVVGDRHLRDEARFVALFRWQGSGRVPAIRAWRIIRESCEEEWWTQARTRASERYVLRFVASRTESATSERAAQEIVDAAMAAFRATKSLGTAYVNKVGYPAVGYLSFGGIRCHYIEVGLDLEELYTVNATTPTPANNNRATTRDMYGRIADQLRTYLSAVTGSGRVYAERRFSRDETNARELYMVPSDDDAKTERILAWRIYRRADAESVELDNRRIARSVWALDHSRSWWDDGGSYDDTQQHVDAVRAMWRGLGSTGHVDAETKVETSPLQVRDIGARMLHGHLVHFARTELITTEVTH
jgi:hypothetical protein